MEATAPALIRNVALVGHGGTGKTTLTEALLVEAGVINRPGRVEDGTTVADTEPEEHHHHLSVSLTLAPFPWKGHKVNVLDTPGSPDFEGDAVAALAVVDLAVFVVSAVDGVQAQTRELWRVAASLGLPRMMFVNKLDRDRSSFDATLAELRAVFGAGVAPLELPIGAEGRFHGVADLLTDTAFLYDGAERTSGPVPAEMADVEHEIHDNLVEGIVVADDDVLERYLDGQAPSFEELERLLAIGIDDATVFPVVCGSATEAIGIDRLADLICEIGPSPLDRPPVRVHAGDPSSRCPPTRRGNRWPGCFARPPIRSWATWRCSRSCRARWRPTPTWSTAAPGTTSASTGCSRSTDATAPTWPRWSAGDIAAVAKLNDAAAGDTLAPKGTPVTIEPLPVLEPCAAVAVAAATPADEDKLSSALHRLLVDDPSLRLLRDDETHQSVLWGRGELHLTITLERLSRVFGVQVRTERVRTAYRETITTAARAEGRHKKQSGGHGQFGVATIVVEPLGRGEGFEFVDEVVGGAIPKGFVAAVEKGILEAMADGGPHGYPVVDVRVRCVDGRHHPVDSSEMSFKMAGRLALRAALPEAGPVVLEPISLLEVTAPDEVLGDVMGDLSARRARVLGTESDGGGESVIRAEVPASELDGYIGDLRARTGGRGRFHAEPVRYDVLPDHLVDASTADTASDADG